MSHFTILILIITFLPAAELIETEQGNSTILDEKRAAYQLWKAAVPLLRRKPQTVLKLFHLILDDLGEEFRADVCEDKLRRTKRQVDFDSWFGGLPITACEGCIRAIIGKMQEEIAKAYSDFQPIPI